ncbi:hypothetical protein [Spirosoma sp.]|uniref:hypothetical protein n=1 Tax=Spirosoma sp. TaxID=1899569 RepID=UPI002638A26D|nr:hypothetical protein [Spirosoma sp.]MCX6215360.1 hypothetical protein [Spirosoma sp.]
MRNWLILLLYGMVISQSYCQTASISIRNCDGIAKHDQAIGWYICKGEVAQFCFDVVYSQINNAMTGTITYTIPTIEITPGLPIDFSQEVAHVTPLNTVSGKTDYSIRFTTSYTLIDRNGAISRTTQSYEGSFSLTVVDPKPSVISSKGLLLLNEAAVLTGDGCVTDNDYEWKNDCDNFWTKSPTNQLTVGIGTYRVRCDTKVCNVGKSDPSRPINIIRDTPPPSNLNCQNPLAENIYNFTRNGRDDRIDYHQYNVTTTACKTNSGNSKCTVENVWLTLKSNVWNNAPLPQDIAHANTGNAGIVFGQLAFTTFNKEVENCGRLVLPAVTSVLLNLQLLAKYGVTFNGAIRRYINQNITGNPITQIIDENTHSISNYTEIGHFLYPGRVVRTVVEECGEIKIKTVGVGRSYLGNTPAGQAMGVANTTGGAWLFEQVDSRVLQLIGK